MIFVQYVTSNQYCGCGLDVIQYALSLSHEKPLLLRALKAQIITKQTTWHLQNPINIYQENNNKRLENNYSDDSRTIINKSGVVLVLSHFGL
jgi:hypothetical protein